MPRDYYLATPYEFYCAIEGYISARKEESLKLRIASYRIHQSLVEKPLTLEKYWPIDDIEDDNSDELIMTPELLQQIKQAHNIQ